LLTSIHYNTKADILASFLFISGLVVPCLQTKKPKLN
jgi:hypothetical protein